MERDFNLLETTYTPTDIQQTHNHFSQSGSQLPKELCPLCTAQVPIQKGLVNEKPWEFWSLISAIDSDIVPMTVTLFDIDFCSLPRHLESHTNTYFLTLILE